MSITPMPRQGLDGSVLGGKTQSALKSAPFDGDLLGRQRSPPAELAGLRSRGERGSVRRSGVRRSGWPAAAFLSRFHRGRVISRKNTRSYKTVTCSVVLEHSRPGAVGVARPRCESGQPNRLPTRPGVGAHVPAADYVGPIHFPDGVWPLVFWKRMSEPPSFVPMACQLGPGLVLTARRRSRYSRSFPRSRPDRCSCSATGCRNRRRDEIARSDSFPTRPRIGAHRPAADQGAPVHVPNRDLSVGVLPQDVGMTVAVEVARSDHFQPARDWA